MKGEGFLSRATRFYLSTWRCARGSRNHYWTNAFRDEMGSSKDDLTRLAQLED